MCSSHGEKQYPCVCHGSHALVPYCSVVLRLRGTLEGVKVDESQVWS